MVRKYRHEIIYIGTYEKDLKTWMITAVMFTNYAPEKAVRRRCSETVRHNRIMGSHACIFITLLAVPKFSRKLGRNFEFWPIDKLTTLRLAIWPSMMLLWWTETEVWTLIYSSKSLKKVSNFETASLKTIKSFYHSFVTTVKPRHAPTIWKTLRGKSLRLLNFGTASLVRHSQ